MSSCQLLDVQLLDIMTLYWWMHWFWITVWISSSFCKPTSPPVHSNITELSTFEISNVTSYPSTSVVASTSPSTTSIVSTSTKNHTDSSNVPSKNTRPYLKKIDFLFQNLTSKNKTIENMSLTESSTTENQLHINLNYTMNHTDNLTYLGEDVTYNQSAIRNSERIGIEEEDPKIAEGNLTAAGITGITMGCIVFVGLLSGISYFVYRNRGFNRPQVLNDHCSNPDSSGYIDDASVRDNSEEMYSLDNDSFLNSLEAMTIQNYWTDTVKHTKL